MFSLASPVRAALLATALAGAAVLASAPAVAAPPAQQRQQVPGYYRLALGAFEVTALYDGFIDLDSKILLGTTPDEVRALTARMFIAKPEAVQTAVNAFLVHTGDRLVLVDTGAAQLFGPTVGAILRNLKAAGYDAGQVDTVLLTHLHPDHVAGLLLPDGTPAFPNAVVRAAAADAEFWLDEQVAAKAAKESQPFFKMARDSVAPYVAAGRFKPFKPDEELMPGVTAVTAVPSPGHTPGHSSYLFTSNGENLLVWGDIVHSHSVQFTKPEVAIEFDVDSVKAVETRKRLLAEAAAKKLLVGGAHLPFPGVGHVRAEPAGYAWVPVEYGPLR